MIKQDDDNNDDRDNFWVELGEDESFEIDDFAEADVCQVSEEFSKKENLLKLWRETSFGQVLNFVRSGDHSVEGDHDVLNAIFCPANNRRASCLR